MAAPAGEGGATARALRAESRTPPSALMEGPGLPRQGGAHSDTGPGGAGWRGWAGRWLLSSAAPAPLNTPRPTWRTLNLDWPPLSANPSATAIPTLHRARARAQRRPGESARSAGTGARARERGRARSGRAAGTGHRWRGGGGAAAPRGTPSRVGGEPSLSARPGPLRSPASELRRPRRAPLLRGQGGSAGPRSPRPSRGGGSLPGVNGAAPFPDSRPGYGEPGEEKRGRAGKCRPRPVRPLGGPAGRRTEGQPAPRAELTPTRAGGGAARFPSSAAPPRARARAAPAGGLRLRGGGGAARGGGSAPRLRARPEPRGGSGGGPGRPAAPPAARRQPLPPRRHLPPGPGPSLRGGARFAFVLNEGETPPPPWKGEGQQQEPAASTAALPACFSEAFGNLVQSRSADT